MCIIAMEELLSCCCRFWSLSLSFIASNGPARWKPFEFRNIKFATIVTSFIHEVMEYHLVGRIFIIYMCTRLTYI